MYSLVKHGHHSLVSLVNLQITGEDADLILNALGRSGSLPNLLHVNVEVFGVLSERHDTDFEEEREDDSFERSFTRSVDAVARFLARCPALTSVGVAETNEAAAGLRLLDLFHRSEETLQNVRSLSLQMPFASRNFDLRYFTRGTRMDSVVNLQIRTRATTSFMREGFLSEISTVFPRVVFLYIAYRFTTEKLAYTERCDMERYRGLWSGNAIAFPATLRHSLETLALDRCFASEQNISRLQGFGKLEKLIVVTPTMKLYDPVYEDCAGGGRYKGSQLNSESIEPYKRLLYCGGFRSDRRRRISLEEHMLDTATKWTTLAASDANPRARG